MDSKTALSWLVCRYYEHKDRNPWGLDFGDLMDHCRPYLSPEDVEFWDKLDYNTPGKDRIHADALAHLSYYARQEEGQRVEEMLNGTKET